MLWNNILQNLICSHSIYFYLRLSWPLIYWALLLWMFSSLFLFNCYLKLFRLQDDLKHRSEWRQLYSKEECDQLKQLITACRSAKFIFVGLGISARKYLKSISAPFLYSSTLYQMNFIYVPLCFKLCSKSGTSDSTFINCLS